MKSQQPNPSKHYHSIMFYIRALETKLETLLDTFSQLPKEEKTKLMTKIEHTVANLRTFNQCFAHGAEDVKIIKAHYTKFLCMQDGENLLIRILREEEENKEKVQN